jgi:transposase
MGDEVGPIFTATAFTPLFAVRGRPADAPWRLALGTIRHAADAVRRRIDWTYARGLERTDPGFDSTVLGELRARLVVGQAAAQLLDALLERCRDRQLLNRHGRQRTDSPHGLGAIRAVNRVGCVAETMRHALNRLAGVAPGWVRAPSRPHGRERYGPRVHDDRVPKGEASHQAYAHAVGVAGYPWRDAVDAEETPRCLREVPAVATLRRLWMQPCYRSQAGVRWRTAADGLPPAARMISSPDDLDAPSAKQDTTSWGGDTVHVTETCEPEQPPLITHGESTAGPVAEAAVMKAMHEQWQAKQWWPRRHLVDTGDLDAERLVTTQRDDGVAWWGPTRPDATWQARAGPGFEASPGEINWEQQQAIGPMGPARLRWTPTTDRLHNQVIKLNCSQRDGQACASRLNCTRAKRRTITVRPQAPSLRLQAARQRDQRAADQSEYAKRAGIEGTISQAVRACGVRRTRSRDAATTHLQHVLTAAAINCVRVGLWLAGDRPAKTRLARFQALMAQSAAAAWICQQYHF